MTLDTSCIDESQLLEHARPVRNAIFTLGNGVFETNGTEPLAHRSAGYTFVGGLYGDGPPTIHVFPPPGSPARNTDDFPTDRDCFRHTTPGLAACPNLFAIRMRLNGRMVQDAVECIRTLDMKRGILRSTCEIQMPDGALRLVTTRFVSLDDHHLAVERIQLEALEPGRIQITIAVDATVRNANGYDMFDSRRGDCPGDGILAWHGVTAERGSRATVCLAARCEGFAPAAATTGEELLLEYDLQLKRGQRVVIDRFAAIGSSVLDADPDAAAAQSCRRAIQAGFDSCLTRSENIWSKFWQDNDIIIDGPADEQQALRYCIFQLHCATPQTDRYSIGAKLLSGEHYRGCVFWDTDIFILPYLTKAQPEAARRHVSFRHRTLNGAIDNARGYGQAGARYPWEGMPDGSDALGPWVIFAVTQDHVVADVAWGIADYCRWTGDDAFMQQSGREVLAQTARFWMSRIVQSERGFEIRKVCGPDESHARVDNSVYTNILAAENLRTAALGNPDAPDRQDWLNAAERIVVHQPGPDGVVEQFDGFSALPEAPEGMSAYHPDAPRHKVLKQADVIMLPVLFPDLYTTAQMRANYEYYEPRTGHLSTLSEGIHAIVAARIGKAADAYRMFRNALFTDLQNRQTNTDHGLHAAAIGTAPRMVMEGFAGLRLCGGEPQVTVNLPEQWRSVEFPFSFRGSRYRCGLTSRDNGKTFPACRDRGTV